uniref:Chaperone protein DnaK n=1 Tax=Glaucocystis sp. BBH TaxID=2023628 RepID=A0A3G1IUU5_9EUKA|nr:heat shock protein 70 [Glaucocystis sp. BBH]
MVIKKVIGIDLGTTNSVVAGLEGGKPTVITNAEGQRTTPSVVAFTKDGDRLVGQVAKRQAVINVENTYYSVKRFIGRKFSEIEDEAKNVSYKVTGTQNVLIECPALGKSLTPEEISAQVLRKLAEDASQYFGETINQAVITVPAYFNDSQRQATKDAGKIAGLEVLRIINEPTAASLAYGLDKKKNETILVFDLGGGTFDVSILDVGDGVFEVLSTSGDTHLGGDDFDQALVNYFVDDFQKSEGVQVSNDKQIMQRFIEAAEKAKIELSSATQTDITLPFLYLSPSGPKHYDTTLNRAKFEELCAPLIERCRIPVENAIRDAKLQKSDIDEVVLVGGSTRIPAVKELVQKLLNKAPNQSVNPDEVVAIGAAVQGGVLAGEVKDILLLDVIPLSLGVETLGGVMTKIIPRNTTIPTKRYELFSTAQDGQSNVDINILQGERELAKDNKSLGNFRLDGIASAPRGVPQIEVTFDIDANGILSVTAKDKGNGNQNSVTITGASTLDKTEVERLVEEAKRNAELDKEKREKIDLINNAESFIYQVERELKEPNTSSEQKEAVEKIIISLKEAIQEKNYEQIKIFFEKLQQVVSKSGQQTPQTETAEQEQSASSTANDVIDVSFSDSDENSSKS